MCTTYDAEIMCRYYRKNCKITFDLNRVNHDELGVNEIHIEMLQSVLLVCPCTTWNSNQISFHYMQYDLLCLPRDVYPFTIQIYCWQSGWFALWDFNSIDIGACVFFWGLCVRLYLI